MSDPPDDENTSGSKPAATDPDIRDDELPETTADRPEDAIEPSTRRPNETPHQPPAAAPPGSLDRQQTAGQRERGAVDETEPAVDDVGSNWWYWVAAVPIYVVAGLVAGVFATVLFVLGVAVDVGGGMGVGTGAVVMLILLGTVVYGLAGVALSIMFPIGIYLDAKTLAAADVSWDPDPVLYLLVAAASVLLTAFTLSFVVALYYLYRRNKTVGVP